ncbi:MAG: CocE/NonD family hydrolase [Armatimonadetes bacterium]|nr:CocE/NonD family hydrolase [Armatimonadota bacterium]
MKLATDVYLPPGPGPFPIALARTPYDKSGTATTAAQGVELGYAMVVQDTRGRYASEGRGLPYIGDGWWGQWDGYDTLEWIAKQPWCNGKIGTWGGSALGATQLGLAGTGTTRLTCAHIQAAAPTSYHRGIYPGGVFKKSMIEQWIKTTNYPPQAIEPWIGHPVYDDYWRMRDPAFRFKYVNAPAIHIGGWFDTFSQGTIDAFVGFQKHGGKGARGKQKLLMGPWPHGLLIASDKSVGELAFPQYRTPPTQVLDTWRVFDHYLKGIKNGIEQEPPVIYYVMGDANDPKAPGNVWRTASDWPPVKAKATPFYLSTHRTVSGVKPTGGSLSYTYDPKDPAPTVGGPQWTMPPGPIDQRKVEARPDVLVFTSDPLTEPIEVTGRLKAFLWASSDAPDTDFIVKLCDVYPDGRSMNICEGVLRARFRKSFSEETFMKPGRVYRFEIDLWSTSIIFNKGHRIRVDVTSSSYPGYDPNPNTGEPFRGSDRTQVAQNTIWFGGKYASHILMPILDTSTGANPRSKAGESDFIR